jgi:urease accessory protein
VAPAGCGRGDRPRLVDLRSETPLTLRWADGCLYVVGSAFSPLGGDELRLDIEVDAGASLTVRTVAASVAQPSPSGLPSRLTVAARVGEGATLRWLPEPGIATAGAVHETVSVLDLADDAEVVWREEVILGRHGEAGGKWHTRWRVTRAGLPLLVQDTAIGGPDWSSPAVGNNARATGSLLLTSPHTPVLPTPSPLTAVMALAGGRATLVSVLAGDARTVRRVLDAATVGEGARA